MINHMNYPMDKLSPSEIKDLDAPNYYLNPCWSEKNSQVSQTLLINQSWNVMSMSEKIYTEILSCLEVLPASPELPKDSQKKS